MIPRAGVAGMNGDASWQASVIAAVALCLMLAGRLSDAISTGEPAQIAFVVALFVLPLLCAFPRTRLLLSRHRWQVLVAQAVLTCVPFVLFGGQWTQGVSGLLVGLVLLMLPGRLSWPLAGSLFVAEVVVRVGLISLPYSPAASAALWLIIVFVDDCLIFFGLVRLAELVADAQSARREFAELAVTRERLRAAEHLQAAIGERLADVAARAAAARQALPHDPARVRAQIGAAGVTAREAIARARTVTEAHRRPPRPGPQLATPAAGAAAPPRLAWAILVVLLCAFGAQILNDVFISRLTPSAEAAAATGIAAGVTLQLYHSRHAPEVDRPRAWPVTLAIQTLLVYLPFAVPPVRYTGSLAGFAAGSFLLLVPGRWRWAGYAAVVATWSSLYVAVPQTGLTPHPGFADALYVTAEDAGIGLVVYGLSWLPAAARQMAALRDELASAAVLAERLRVARDVHDLLGLGLSAIALKTDLIGRLIRSDDGRAAAEIGEMTRICAHARADIRLVTGAGQHLPLDAELTAAREILTSAGVTVHARIREEPLPAEAAMLAPVLREAVTNILRHSAARTCTIEVMTADGTLRVQIGNDGVPDRPATGGHARRPAAGDGTGRGLANLTARLHAAGGRLTAGEAGGRFELIAEIPLSGSPVLSPPAGPMPGPFPDESPGRPAGHG